MSRWINLSGAAILVLLLALALAPLIITQWPPPTDPALVSTQAGATAPPWPGGWGLGLGALLALGAAAGVGGYRAQARANRALRAELAERIGAEADLRAREEQYRALFEQSPVGIAIARDGVMQTANQAFLDMFGYAAVGQVVGGLMLEHLVPRERVAEIGRMLRQVRGEPVEAHVEHSGLRRDGTTFPMVADIVRVDLPDGQEIRLGFFTDMTRLRRAEEERDQFFTLSRNLLCIVGYDGYFRRLNPAWEATLGLTVEELMAEPYTSFVHPDDHEATHEALNAGATSRSMVGFENRFRCKDGSYRWLSWSYTVMPERRLAYGVAQDVTERKRTEQEQRQLYQVAEGLREVIAVINSRQSLTAVLQYVIAQASRLLDVDAGVIYRLTPAGGAGEVGLRVEAAYGLDAPYLGVTVANAEHTVCHEAIRRRAPIALADAAPVMERLLAEDALGAHYRPMLAELRRRMCAMLTVPLVVKDEIYGTITLYDARVRSFNEEEIKLAVSFARHSALAIENGWLRQQVRQTAIREERSRLARELHDSVTQSLYSLALLAEGWRLATQAEQNDQVALQFARLGEIAQQALREMRLLIHQLRMPELHRDGLIGVLQQRLDAVERRLGIDARLRVEGALVLPAAVEEQLYWIIQEALNNALKHAGATAVEIAIRVAEQGPPAEGAAVEVEVCDNGRGFDYAAAARGFGMDSMRERAEQLGAALVVGAAPGAGTRVAVSGVFRGEGL